jgi:uncharacterized protein YutE (UPF0331/DUF86 family)
MVISQGGFRKPETYKEIIEILGEVGILPEEFAERIGSFILNTLVKVY